MATTESLSASHSAEQPERSEAATAKETAEQPARSEAATARQTREAATAKQNREAASAKKHCELCEAARFTHWYHEDDVCWIADCEACLVPMVVWKPHGTSPSDLEVEHMLACLADAGGARFGSDEFSIDRDMRTIPEHWHAHARDADWHRLRMHRPLSRYTSVGGPRQER